MKFISKISRIAQALVIPCCLLTSCNYLDVIPPEQADFDDTMKDQEAVENFLYTCYGYVPRCQPYDFNAFEQSADELVAPRDWNDFPQQIAWGTVSPSTYLTWGNGKNFDDFGFWIPGYNWLGYVHHFLAELDVLNPVGVTEEDKAQYRAECWFLEAYYHFRILQAMGPCPIIDGRVDPNITTDEIPGRSHFDYCIDYIVNKLDTAATILPAVRETAELGRATSTICKALKARVLLCAASPLWNGSFPHPEWRNTNFETPGYGTELVSPTYSEEKWRRALTAAQEALAAAEAAGYHLFTIDEASLCAQNDGIDVNSIYIPGRDAETVDNEEFKARVLLFQYLVTANEGQGNRELIWANRIDSDGNNGGEAMDARLPCVVVRRTNGTNVGGWGGFAPTLNAVERFYTDMGKLPSQDPAFYPQNEWYTRFNSGASSPELPTDHLDGEDVKNDIIKFHVRREPRFYSWIVFDGSQYMPKINDGNPLWINFKNTNTNGWSQSNTRNCAGTGYLSKKFVDPAIQFRANDGGRTSRAARRPYIRMAELYLNLAECYAALGETQSALDNLNIIRERAGIPDLTTADITGTMTLTDWVRNERFVELYEEGFRYYDVRRWMIAPDVLKAGVRYGLNGIELNPSFEDFNQRTLINQPFTWDERLYLMPIWSRQGMDELYSNPQLVQAPGY